VHQEYEFHAGVERLQIFAEAGVLRVKTFVANFSHAEILQNLPKKIARGKSLSENSASEMKAH